MTRPGLSHDLQLLGRLQQALGRSDRAVMVAALRELVARRANLGRQWQALARMAASIGEYTLARNAIDLFVAAEDGSAEASYQKALFLAEHGALEEADQMIASLPQAVPDPVTNAYTRGTIALNQGRIDEARALFEAVVHARPEVGSAWLSLSMAVDLAGDPALAERLIEAAPHVVAAPVAHRAAWHYALGKTHADRGEHALAFAAFSEGARLMRRLARYDHAKDSAQADDAVRGYTATQIEAVAALQEEATARAIFVTGLPRSGTTLVEQILASHSAVSGGAETSGLALLAMDVGGAPFDALSAHVEAAGSGPAARLWHHLLAERFGPDGRVIDKAVDTSRYLGLAAALLPDAPVVWLTRDPLDRAWSCFRTNFAGSAVAWSYDLADIAAHFRLEDRLLAQWRDILGERILVVPYEELVAQPQAWTRRILAHCGLAEEPQVFAPHRAERAVATASMVQVRQPVHTRARGSAEPYRAFMEPFVAAYGG